MIKIENESLANYVMFKLNKLDNEFDEHDLEKVEEIVINPVDINNAYTPIDLNVIKLFKNLQRIELINVLISECEVAIFKELKNLNSITFDRCQFENSNLLVMLDINSLHLINCDIVDISSIYEMRDLKELSLVNHNIIIEELNRLNKLEYLRISYSNILDVEAMLNLPLLKELYIDNTNIIDLKLINSLPNLQKVSISNNQLENNEVLIQSLLLKNIIVSNENIRNYNSGDLDD